MHLARNACRVACRRHGACQTGFETCDGCYTDHCCGPIHCAYLSWGGLEAQKIKLARRLCRELELALCGGS